MIARRALNRSRKQPSGRWTFAELAAALPESNLPTELLQGEVVMSPAPSFRHQQIADAFHDLLKGWVRKRRLGVTAMAPLDMVLSSDCSLQPDVLFIAKERTGIIKDRIEGPADLVVEVTSAESFRRDHFEKRNLYEKYGVREYWIIDPKAETVEILSLDSRRYGQLGHWRSGQTAHSKILSGFKVKVSELFRSRQNTRLDSEGIKEES